MGLSPHSGLLSLYPIIITRNGCGEKVVSLHSRRGVSSIDLRSSLDLFELLEMGRNNQSKSPHFHGGERKLGERFGFRALVLDSIPRYSPSKLVMERERESVKTTKERKSWDGDGTKPGESEERRLCVYLCLSASFLFLDGIDRRERKSNPEGNDNVDYYAKRRERRRERESGLEWKTRQLLCRFGSSQVLLCWWFCDDKSLFNRIVK